MSAALLVFIGRSDVDDLRILSRVIWFFATEFWMETLMIWHVWVGTANHDLSGVGTSANRTNIRLLYMVISIKIWVDLNVVVITSRFLRLNIAKERCILHITMEGAL